MKPRTKTHSPPKSIDVIRTPCECGFVFERLNSRHASVAFVWLHQPICIRLFFVLSIRSLPLFRWLPSETTTFFDFNRLLVLGTVFYFIFSYYSYSFCTRRHRSLLLLLKFVYLFMFCLSCDIVSFYGLIVSGDFFLSLSVSLLIRHFAFCRYLLWI